MNTTIKTKLAWIKDVAEQLQVPQTYNERQRLLKIMEKAMPQIILALEESAHMGYGNTEPADDGEFIWVQSGYTCNGCGYDHRYATPGETEVAECVLPKDRDGNVYSDCEVDNLLRFLKELEESSDK